MTLEAWPDIADTLIVEGYGGWVLYLVLFITISNFAIVNLMTGVIVEKVMTRAHEERVDRKSFLDDIATFQESMEKVFRIADLDASGELDVHEMRKIFNMKETQEIFKSFGTSVTVPAARIVADAPPIVRLLRLISLASTPRNRGVSSTILSPNGKSRNWGFGCHKS